MLPYGARKTWNRDRIPILRTISNNDSFDNIASGLKVKKVAPDVIKAKVSAVAAKIKISDQQLQRNVSELSGGQQQCSFSSCSCSGT